MGKRFLSIVGAIGCLVLMLLALASTILLSRFIHVLPAFAICSVFFTLIFFILFNALYRQGVKIRTAAFYDECVDNFNEVKVDTSDDFYAAPEGDEPADKPSD